MSKSPIAPSIHNGLLAWCLICTPTFSLAQEAELSLPDIIVTGEKTDRSLYDTSSSVNVYSDEELNSSSTKTHISDLLETSPNIVNVGHNGGIATVRGVDGSGPGEAVAFLTGTRPRLNVSLDGRSLSYAELAFGARSLWDSKQVEVFLGPQSYIQGRNAIAGALLVTSKDPVYTPYSKIKIAAASQEYTQMGAVLSGPIVDNQLAFRISVEKQKKMSDADLESYTEVGNPRRIEQTTARIKLLYEPLFLPDFKTQLTWHHSDTRAPQAQAKLANFLSPVFKTRSDSGILDSSYKISNGFNFKNKLIYTDIKNQRKTQTNGVYADIDGYEVQVEPVMQFKTDNEGISGLFGLRYFKNKQDEFINLFGGSPFKDETTTSSAFAEATIKLPLSLKLKLATRIEREHRTRKGGGKGKVIRGKLYNVAVDFDQTYTTVLPKIDLSWHANKRSTIGFMMGRGYRAGGAGLTFGSPWKSFTYKPEYVTNYEFYTRHGLYNGQVILTSNLFFNEYDDMQLPYYLSPSAVTVVNAEETETYGSELGINWLFNSGLELFAKVGLLKTEIKSFKHPSYVGNALSRAPEFSSNVGAIYSISENLSVNLDASYTSDYFTQMDNKKESKVKGHWLSNMQMSYGYKNLKVSVFAKNLLNSRHTVSMLKRGKGFLSIKQDPRMVGASLELEI